jgi:histone-lysine N-methyltransferase SETD1
VNRSEPAQCFCDHQNWYLTFKTLEAARRAQLILGSKPFCGVPLYIWVDPPPSMAEAYAPVPAIPARPDSSPIKLSYSGRASLPTTPARRTTTTSTVPQTDAEIARDARNLVVRELLAAFERDLRTRVLEPRVRELVDKRNAALGNRIPGFKAESAAAASTSATATATAPEASGSAVKLPSFARKQRETRSGPASYVKKEVIATVGKPARKPLSYERPRAKPTSDRERERDRESDGTESDAASEQAPVHRRKLTANKVERESTAALFGREDSTKPDQGRLASSSKGPARRRSFTSSDDDDGPVVSKAKSKPAAVEDTSWLDVVGDDGLAIAGRSAKHRASRMHVEYSDEEGQGETAAGDSMAAVANRVRERIQLDAAELERRFEVRDDDDTLPDPFDDTMRVADDDEDLHYVRLALERIRVGEPMHPYAEDAPDNAPELAHGTGSARTEGYYKIAPAAKSAYLPLRNRAQVDIGHVSATAVSRAARATTRRFVAGIEQQKKELTSDTDVVKFNQLRTRKKQLKFARSPIHDWVRAVLVV